MTPKDTKIKNKRCNYLLDKAPLTESEQKELLELLKKEKPSEERDAFIVICEKILKSEKIENHEKNDADLYNELGKELFFTQFINIKGSQVIIDCSCEFNANKLGDLLEQVKLSK